jgi:hypothetical protein
MEFKVYSLSLKLVITWFTGMGLKDQGFGLWVEGLGFRIDGYG